MVADYEVLVRLLLPGSVRPDEEAEQRKLVGHTIRAVDEFGLSVFRRSFNTERTLRAKAKHIADRRNVHASQIGFATILCADIRSINLSGTRVYCVYDSATEADPSHADVHRGLDFPSGTPNQRAVVRTHREKLAKRFDLHDSLSDVFSWRGPDKRRPPIAPPWSIN